MRISSHLLAGQTVVDTTIETIARFERLATEEQRGDGCKKSLYDGTLRH